jgi:uncharacterized protein
MRIGIDIDDTLTETSEIMEKVAIEHNHEYENKLTDELPAMLRGILDDNIVKEFFKKHCEEICKQVRIKDGAKDVIDMLLQDGHEVIFITARSKTYFPDPYKLTEEFLKNNNINYTKLITGHEQKVDICRKEHIDVFFDDSYDTVKNLYNDGIDAVLFTSIDNYYLYTSLNRVKNWDELYNYICNK